MLPTFINTHALLDVLCELYVCLNLHPTNKVYLLISKSLGLSNITI